VQRKAKRQAHSQFHNMILRYDDDFWATGTPPNGWGCQCYRNQLTDSQAKAQGSIGVPQASTPTQTSPLNGATTQAAIC